MAKLNVSFDLVAQTLFPGALVSIHGVSRFDEHTMTLDIDGPDVPVVAQVICQVTTHRTAVKFLPLGAVPTDEG